MCRASVQGITFYKSKTVYDEIELPPSHQKSIPRAPRKDGRSNFNKSRSGESIVRNGNCIRTGEIRKRIHSWCGAIGGCKRIRFFTITFPEGTQDEDGKKALNIWLTRLRFIDSKVNYFWTAERQRNGTIHFHLLLDRHFSIQMVNGWMKTTLINMGEKIPWSNQDHKAIYGGVNVKQKVYSGHGVEKYLIKYLTKSSFSGIGQPWHSSRELGKLAVRVRKPSSILMNVLQTAYFNARRPFKNVRLFWENGILYVPFPDGYNVDVAKWLENANGWQKGGNFGHSKYHSPASPVVPSLEPQSQFVTTTVIEKSPPQLVLPFDWIPQRPYQTRK